VRGLAEDVDAGRAFRCGGAGFDAFVAGDAGRIGAGFVVAADFTGAAFTGADFTGADFAAGFVSGLRAAGAATRADFAGVFFVTALFLTTGRFVVFFAAAFGLFLAAAFFAGAFFAAVLFAPRLAAVERTDVLPAVRRADFLPVFLPVLGLISVPSSADRFASAQCRRTCQLISKTKLYMS